MSSASDTIPRRLLHVLTRADDALAQETIARQKSRPGDAIEVFDLTSADPDYGALLEAIFAADSTAVW